MQYAFGARICDQLVVTCFDKNNGTKLTNDVTMLCMGSMHLASLCLEHHSTMCTHFTSPSGGTCNSLLPGLLIQVLNGPFPHFNTNTVQRISFNFMQLLHIACRKLLTGCSCHHYAATDCAWFMYLIFLHSPVHTSWNSINVVNNSRLEYLRLAIIVVFLLRAICSSSYGPYLCQKIKSRLD